MRMLLGAHMSIAGGFARAAERGRAATCTAIQLFTKNNMQWRARPLAAGAGREFQAACRAQGIEAAFGHTSYLINLGAVARQTARRSVASLGDEIRRAQRLGLPFLVLHPGNHMGSGEAAGLRRVADRLGEALDVTADSGVQIALETTAGQGTSLGYSFEHLAFLIETTAMPERLGVCFDTAHLFAAGYDIRTPAGCRRCVGELLGMVGRDRLLAVHLNDSKAELGSRVDRHEHIGGGRIGLGAFWQLMNDRRLRRVPMVLETPKGTGAARDLANLARLRSLVGRPQPA